MVVPAPDTLELNRVKAWFSAVVSDDLTLMDDLLAHGVPVDVPHPLRHTTALMEATRRGRTSTVHWLLARGAIPVFLCGVPRGSPLHCALKLHHWDVAQALIDASGTTALTDEHGRTPLHVLAAESPEWEARGQPLLLAKSLVEKSCPIDTLDREGITALHYAVIHDCAPLVELLLALGAKPDIAAPDSGMTPLAMVALDRNQNLAALLMQYGANPHQPIRDGQTPATIFPALTRMVAGVPPAHAQPAHTLDDIPLQPCKEAMH